MSHVCIAPQAGHLKLIPDLLATLNVPSSIAIPVGTSFPVVGHFIIIRFP